jgi:carbamoyl-phosphate synthase large subunit
LWFNEVNPRASRTIPFLGKAIGKSLAKYAALVQAGQTLTELGFTKEIIPQHYSVKEAVFPFVRFPGLDIILSPEMKSTGEVMGIADTAGMAFLKAQDGAGNRLPREGAIMISLTEADRLKVLSELKSLDEMGYEIYATKGTATFLWEHGIKANALFKMNEGHPNTVDLIKEKMVKWVINTPSGAQPRKNEVAMRAAATIHGIPVTTTIPGFKAAVEGLRQYKSGKSADVNSLQNYHAAIK